MYIFFLFKPFPKSGIYFLQNIFYYCCPRSKRKKLLLIEFIFHSDFIQLLILNILFVKNWFHVLLWFSTYSWSCTNIRHFSQALTNFLFLGVKITILVENITRNKHTIQIFMFHRWFYTGIHIFPIITLTPWRVISIIFNDSTWIIVNYYWYNLLFVSLYLFI